MLISPTIKFIEHEMLKNNCPEDLLYKKSSWSSSIIQLKLDQKFFNVQDTRYTFRAMIPNKSHFYNFLLAEV